MKKIAGVKYALGVAGLLTAMLGFAPSAHALEFPSIGVPEITIDASYYKYRETTSNGAFFMQDESSQPFISAGVRNWDQAPHVGEFAFMYTVDAGFGKVDYSSAGSGTMKKDYYRARTEGYLSYRYGMALSPFVGLGYRTLLDNSGGKQSSTNASGYDRLSRYLYIPIGAKYAPNRKLSFKAQYNYFVGGKQTSYLSTANGFASSPDVDNWQHQGWGMDFTANYQTDAHWSFYTFYRYWDIGKSSLAHFSYGGSNYAGYEPDNTTEEAGIGVAFRF